MKGWQIEAQVLNVLLGECQGWALFSPRFVGEAQKVQPQGHQVYAQNAPIQGHRVNASHVGPSPAQHIPGDIWS